MADPIITPISTYTAAGDLDGTEQFAVAQGAVGAKVTRSLRLSVLLAWILGRVPSPAPQVGWLTPALGVAEEFGMLVVPAGGWTIPANFSGNTGALQGSPPASDFVIRVRHYLATGADNGEIGTITIKADRTIVRATTGGTAKVLAAGSSLIFFGPTTPQAVTKFVERLQPVVA